MRIVERLIKKTKKKGQLKGNIQGGEEAISNQRRYDKIVNGLKHVYMYACS